MNIFSKYKNQLISIASFFFFVCINVAILGAKNISLAVGISLLILVHEFGHMWMYKAYRIHTTPPFFIPVVGAIVDVYQNDLMTRKIEMRIAIAGPVLGTAASALVGCIFVLDGNPYWLNLSAFGIFFNSFNTVATLYPFDGARVLCHIHPGFRYLAIPALLLLFLWNPIAGVFIGRLAWKDLKMLKKDTRPLLTTREKLFWLLALWGLINTQYMLFALLARMHMLQ